jgi:hypothetical protein
MAEVLRLEKICRAVLPLLLVFGCHSKEKASEQTALTPNARSFDLKAVGKASCERPVIDDFEDNDTDISIFDDRSGSWYTYKDKNGTTLSPDPLALTNEGAQGSKQGIRIFGKTGQDVDTFAGLGVPLSDTLMPYDLSGVSGICFRAKGAGTARVMLPDVNTFPQGGRCKSCYNSFGKDFQLTPDWQELCFRFEKMAQKRGWGEPAPALASDKVFGIQFQIYKHDLSYDLWLDDIRLSCDPSTQAAATTAP